MRMAFRNEGFLNKAFMEKKYRLISFRVKTTRNEIFMNPVLAV
jgi:hypothetical protein